jgi:hypothetical protein
VNVPIMVPAVGLHGELVARKNSFKPLLQQV